MADRNVFKLFFSNYPADLLYIRRLASIGVHGGHYTSYIAIVHRSILYYINLYPTKVYEYLMLELNCSINLRITLPVDPSVLATG